MVMKNWEPLESARFCRQRQRESAGTILTLASSQVKEEALNSRGGYMQGQLPAGGRRQFRRGPHLVGVRKEAPVVEFEPGVQLIPITRSRGEGGGRGKISCTCCQ